MITILITRLGDYLTALPEGARKTIVLGFLLVLGGGGIYKLTVNLRKLSEPLPAASPLQFIDPMQDLFRVSKNKVFEYHETRKWGMTRLDSLKNQFTKKPTTRP